jgi:hypothetical protein
MCALGRATCFRDAPNISQYIRQTRWLEVHDLWRAWQSLGKPRNRAITDRTNVAQLLSQNYIGTQLSQERLIDCINCPVIPQCATHPSIDFATR